ncbi:AlpA family phage regulatory protein [Ramlibacter henchirensis]|uniref:AlpA family phage regulatory protein n=1 Tax=Ramlibacter henchirensis TaxID=204072 RepID=A0A4Z0BRX4_9BURK|nr:AlpA family phage regulatory protein [Ramlibacter henchirensis]
MRLEQFIRPAEMPKHTGCAQSTAYADVKAGLLPPPVKLGRRSSGWIAREVAAVQQARIAGSSEGEIRKLVAELVRQRHTATT